MNTVNKFLFGMALLIVSVALLILIGATAVISPDTLCFLCLR